MSAAHPMPPERERTLYYDGIRLFNERDFFEAHEAWEEIWHLVYDHKKRFYQGLIQAAVALEHYRRSNPRGLVSLHRSYPPKFRGLPDVFMGLEIAPFLAAMDQILLPVVTARPLPQKGTITLDLSHCPTIRLVHDPFAEGR